MGRPPGKLNGTNKIYKSKNSENTFIIKNNNGIIEVFLDKRGIIVRTINIVIIKPYEYIEIGHGKFKDECLAFYFKFEKLNNVIMKMLENLAS